MSHEDESLFVSIITPAYNADQFIETTLLSVMNQDYSEFEHVVIDDGSTDSTPDLLRSYENQYSLRWHSKRNEGQAITVNRAFKMAKGDVVIWLNADDVLFDRSTIRDVVNTFQEKRVDVVYGHMAIIDEENSLLRIQYAPSSITLSTLLLGHFAPCICYRKEIALKYPLKPRFRNALDYEQCMRIASDGNKFGLLDNPIIGWRKHGGAKSLLHSENLMKETKLVKSLYQKKESYLPFYKSINLYLELFVRKILGLQDIFSLLRRASSFHPAFPLRIDSVSRLLMRQIIPYS